MSFAGFAFTDPACSHPYFDNMEVQSARTVSREVLANIDHLFNLIVNSNNTNLKAFSEKALKLREIAISLNDGLNHAY